MPNVGLIMQNITISTKYFVNLIKILDSMIILLLKQILRKFHGKQRLLCFQISIDNIGSSLYFLEVGQKFKTSIIATKKEILT